MPRLLRSISVVGMLAVFAGLASAQVFTCNTNVTVTPVLRGEGFTEPTGDITVSCTGGSVLAPGSAIPLVYFTISYNTTVTSRLLPTAGNPATSNVSEAFLLIDEPGSGLSGYGPSLPQKLCTTPLTGCAAWVGAVPGPTLGTAVSSGSTPAANLYQGVVSGNSVTFYGVPVLPSGIAASRVFRMTNVRVNAVLLSGSYGTPVNASISTNPPGALSLFFSTPNVGFVINGLSASASSATDLGQCSSQTRTSVGTLTFTENFGTAFKTRVAAQSNTLYAGQLGVLPANPDAGNQNTPGAIYNSESNFVFAIPGSSPAQVAGLTDFGTRLKATFNNIPAGARLFVSTANVYNNASPRFPPAVIGGNAANANPASGPYVGYAQLVTGESTSDGDAGTPGTFPTVAATDNGPGSSGIVPAAEVFLSGGTGSAVWEVVNTNPNTNESFKFAVYITYTGGIPLPGTSTVNLSDVSTAISGVAADAGSPLPRFASDSSAARALFAIQSCTAPSLSIAKTHAGNFTRGQRRRILSRCRTRLGPARPAGR